MTRPPEVPAPKGGCQLSRASLRQGQAPQGPAGRSQGSTSAAKRVEVQAREWAGEAPPETSGCPPSQLLLPARPSRRRHIPPAGGAGAGLALPIGAGEPGTLPPCSPAVRPSRSSRRPEPSGASGRGEEEDHEFLERDQLTKRPGGRAAEARPKGVVAPGPRAAPVPAPRPPRPAAWPGAHRCGCCASWPSGRPPRSYSACRGPQVGPAGPRPPYSTSSVSETGVRGSRVRPFLRDPAPAASPAPVLPSEGCLEGPLSARLGSVPQPAPRCPGLLSIRRALGMAKCFQRPGGRRRRPRGAPCRGFPRVVSVNAVQPRVCRSVRSSQDLASALLAKVTFRGSRTAAPRYTRDSPHQRGRRDQAKGSAPPDPRHLVERGFGFPFVGPSPPSPTAGRWRFLCLGWGSPGGFSATGGPGLLQAGWKGGPGSRVAFFSRVAGIWAA